jgi:hypothetical protein
MDITNAYKYIQIHINISIRIYTSIKSVCLLKSILIIDMNERLVEVGKDLESTEILEPEHELASVLSDPLRPTWISHR